MVIKNPDQTIDVLSKEILKCLRDNGYCNVYEEDSRGMGFVKFKTLPEVERRQAIQAFTMVVRLLALKSYTAKLQPYGSFHLMPSQM